MALEGLVKEVQQLKQDMAQMRADIDKLKFHNFTLLTIIGSVMEGDAVTPSLQEASVLFDLSKQELRAIIALVSDYDGDLAAFKSNAAQICDTVSEQNVMYIVEGIENSYSGNLLANAERVLADEASVALNKNLCD